MTRNPAFTFWHVFIVSMVFATGLVGCTKSAGESAKQPGIKAGDVPANLRLVLYYQLPPEYIEVLGRDQAGPLDLARAAKVETTNPSVGQAQLQQAGFQRGYRLVWAVENVDYAAFVSQVVLLGSPQQALGYFNIIESANKSSPNDTFFPTSGIVDSAGYTELLASPDGGVMVQRIDLVHGPLFYELEFFGRPGSITPSGILNIARSQSAKTASLGFA